MSRCASCGSRGLLAVAIALLGACAAKTVPSPSPPPRFAEGTLRHAVAAAPAGQVITIVSETAGERREHRIRLAPQEHCEVYTTDSGQIRIVRWRSGSDGTVRSPTVERYRIDRLIAISGAEQGQSMHGR